MCVIITCVIRPHQHFSEKKLKISVMTGVVLSDKFVFLSNASKEILLKFVIHAISTYVMSILLLPQRVYRDISSIMSQFWWSNIKIYKKLP